MKKLFYLFILATSSFCILAQNQISGIGKLKLYSPLSLISELGYTNDTKVINNQTDYFTLVYEKFSGDKMYEIVQDSITEFGYGGYYNRDVRVFYLPSYQVVPTITINCLELTFYKDSLISINCFPSEELKEALDLKYGHSKIDLKEKDHTYTNTYTGTIVVKTDQTITKTWNTNLKDVICQSVVTVWYNDKAEKLTICKFELSDNLYLSRLSEIENGIKIRISERKELARKQRYDGI